ncbi:MAG: LPS-assembly protein LptD [Bacteroidales bacterium]|nr:LPS-assembly protein LptD [Bacteroidales bacterium]
MSFTVLPNSGRPHGAAHGGTPPSLYAVPTADTTDTVLPLPLTLPDTLTVAAADGHAPDSVLPLPDSLRLAVPDSLSPAPSDSLLIDSLQTPPLLEAPIEYKATDSISFDISVKKVFFYTGGQINYQDIELKADAITLDMDTREVFAIGVEDTAGVWQGKPVFKDGSDEMSSSTMRYNFKTQKGIITDLKTNQGEGTVLGKLTKKVDKKTFLMKDGQYTTCDADHPHFFLNMTKAKVISGKTTITGPAYMVLEDVPLYPIFLPFGFFPSTESYSSGIIIPSYGEEGNRGFFLRDGGYYWAASQYFDLNMKGDIYSRGSWATYLNSNYKKRYKYSGNVSLSYNINQYGEKEMPDFYRTKGFSVRWSHTQDAKANPFQTFSASVNLSTSSYDKENALDMNSYLTNTKSSSISYSKKWENSPFNMSVNARHSQNSSDSTMSLGLPELTLSMSKIYPFRKKQRSGKLKPWEEIGFSYTANIRNSITAKEREILHKSIVKDWSNGWQHSIPISLPSLTLLKHINISPGISYAERWYLSSLKQRYFFDPVTRKGTVDVDTVYGFKRNYDYSGSISASTNIYGTFEPRVQMGRLIKMRHKMTPSISMSYRPDFGNPKYGFWDSYRDESGKTVYYNRFANGIFGSAGRGESGAVSFSLDNNLEAKLKAKSDTATVSRREAESEGKKSNDQKISIIDNLGLSGSYNLVADSMKLSNISLRGRTTIKGVSINFGGTLNPYMTDSLGRSYNAYTFDHKTGLARLGRLTNANLSFGMTFQSKKKDGGASLTPTAETDPTLEGEQPPVPEAKPKNDANQLPYAEFNMPWSINFNYSLNYSKPSPVAKSNITQTLNFSGSLKLTEKWDMRMTTNFDIQAREFSFTTFTIQRSLHCFQMSFNFVPFGARKSYAFLLSASSSMLRDLKIDKKRSWYDR